MDNREYVDRDGVLLELGYKSYLGYLRSPLWDLIRREILFRDGCTCRNPVCPFGSKGPKQAHHLAYSRPTLLGINPSCIVTLCKGCHEYVEFDDGKKRDPVAARKLTFYVVSRLNQKKGRGDGRIGKWYRDQWMLNQESARRVFRRIRTELPEWHDTILLQIRARLVSKLFIPYLGLKVVPPGNPPPIDTGELSR